MKNNDMIMDLESYRESCIGALMDVEEVDKIIDEMKSAKVGTIKPNWWEKISDTEFIIFVM